MSENEIFDKGDNIEVKEKSQISPKPKRKLTEKQLENLKKGREKMALKRAKEREKNEVKASKQHQKIKSTGVAKKRATLKEINKRKEDEILSKLMKKEKDNEERSTLFEELKVKCYGTAKNVKEYNQMKEALEGIDDSILHDDAKLKAHAKKVLEPFTKQSRPSAKMETIKE